MPIHTSWAPRRSNLLLVALIMAVLAAAGCGGGRSNSFTPVEVLYSTGGTFNTGLQFQIFPINPATGTLGPPAMQNNIFFGPTAITPSGRFFYAVGSAIYGYSIGPEGMLTPLPGSPFAENFSALKLTIDPTGKFLYVSDSFHSSLAGFAIDSSTGTLTPVPGSPFPNKFFTNRAAFNPSGTFLYVVDGGSDSGIAGLSGYSVDPTTGSLTPISGGSFTFSSSGSENFDVAVHTSGLLLYFTENDGIHGFTINPSTGVLTPISSGPLVALPSPMQLKMNSLGTTLYVAVAGAGTIAAYSVNPTTGGLTEVAGSPYQVVPNPAPAAVVFHFSLDPLGQFLYSEGAQPNVGGIVEFNVNSSTGGLTQLGFVPVPQPPEPGNPGPLPFVTEQLP